jgi:hypothetical protein
VFDLTRDIEFRAFDLNTVTQVPGSNAGRGLAGCQIDVFSPDDVDVVQFREKRSQQDGLDAGPPFLGGRRIIVAGVLYDVSRPLLWDRYQRLRAALTPTLAYRASPDDKGFEPLLGSRPTANIDDFDDGVVLLRALCMPTGLRADMQRDNIGGDDTDALALPWQTQFIMREPQFQNASPQSYEAADDVSGTLVNRGDYHAPIDIVASITSASGTLTVEVGGSVMVLTIPSSTGARLLRYVGKDKVLYVTEEDASAALRMSWMDFTNNTTHPLVPAGESPYTITFSDGLTLVADTELSLSFYETWA